MIIFKGEVFGEKKIFLLFLCQARDIYNNEKWEFLSLWYYFRNCMSIMPAMKTFYFNYKLAIRNGTTIASGS